MDKKRIGAVTVVCLLVCGATQGGLVLDQFQELRRMGFSPCG